MDNNSNIIQALNNISLEDEEEGGVEIVAEAVEGEHLQPGFDAKLCVVGRFITEGRVDFEAMQHTLALLWKPEKFCGLLFEKEESEIVKPYGAWMRAPLRKQIKPVGAKWLRHGGTADSSESMSQSQGKQNGEDGGNRWPVVTPTNQGPIEYSENQGNMITQIMIKDGNTGQGPLQTNTATTKEQMIKKDIGIIETKKRRTEDGPSYDKTGHNTEVLMDSDDVNDTDMHIGGPD
ncbi:hypothetical protein ACET3Z_015315 [Daucus carota]